MIVPLSLTIILYHFISSTIKFFKHYRFKLRKYDGRPRGANLSQCLSQENCGRVVSSSLFQRVVVVLGAGSAQLSSVIAQLTQLVPLPEHKAATGPPRYTREREIGATSVGLFSN